MEKFNPIKIEEKWRKEWEKTNRWQVDMENSKKPYYNLMMFPYPSAEGLHMGNVFAFTGSDIHGRFRRLQGYNVFEPIGFDAFGINTENFAIKENIHPKPLSARSIARFRDDQLKKLGALFDWNFQVNTADPEYYKWTQWLFLQLFKKGLAYKKKAAVDWCPHCKTVLADEQVISGKCERCEHEVAQKELEQWFLQITDYAERLLGGLEKLDWSQEVKTMQKNWIGKSEGVELNFSIENSSLSIRVFTTRPDTLLGATYIVLAPDHDLVEELGERVGNAKEVAAYQEKAKHKTELERTDLAKEKTGVELQGIRATNPANGEEIPVWIADYVLKDYGTGAIMAVPAHDERDLAFAKKFDLPVALDAEVADEKIIKKVGGETKVTYHLRDWLISRQRYWGPPIPIIYCEQCGTVPVPEKDLPVLLPDLEDFQPTGTDKSPLASVEDFVNTTCPKCEGPAKRETDVSDTFLDSSWYFLRYPSVHDEKTPFDPAITKTWLPVDMYIGGKEHSVRHLLYARFVTMALYDMGTLSFEEPFSVFRGHGLLIREGAKMSKSRGNVVIPDEYFASYGTDVTRTYLMFLGPFAQGGDWQDKGIRGITRFMHRVWALHDNMGAKEMPDILLRLRHRTIFRVTEDLENLHYNTAISALMEFVNALTEQEEITKEHMETLLVLLAPFAPHMTEELWQKIGHKDSVHDQKWPLFDDAMLENEQVNMVVQVNGKVRATLSVASGIKEDEVKSLALAEVGVSKWLEGNKVKKTIFVEDKLINFVL